MNGSQTSGRRWLILAACVAAFGVVSVSAQTPAPPAAASSAKAKELVGLLQTRKLEAFAIRDPSESGRFIAALLVPNVQLLLVSAAYERPMDIEYRLYHKDFMGAYMDLNSSIYSKSRMFVEDSKGDGLIAMPGKDPMHDSVKVDTQRQVFDGAYADPKRRNDKRMPQEAYFKAFTSADENYSRLLGLLLEELKKSQGSS
jgi:hypothetical protein